MPLLELGAGNYDSIVDDFCEENLNSPNNVILGKGSGVTFINTNVIFKRWRPKLVGVTIRPESGNCLTMHDTGEGVIDDVWCHPPDGGVGVDCRITLAGQSGIQTSWPDREQGLEYYDSEIRSARITCTSFRDVNIISWDQGSTGGGWHFESEFDWGGNGLGEFLNHIRLFGGHTAVRGTGMYMKWINECAFYSHHMDVPDGSIGLWLDDTVADAEGQNIWWYGPGHVEGKDTNNQTFKGEMKRLHPVGWIPQRPQYEDTATWDQAAAYNNWRSLGGNWLYHQRGRPFPVPLSGGSLLANINHRVNTDPEKTKGALVINNDNGMLLKAAGDADGDIWEEVGGATVITPV